ncbi:MAG: hypothetical protein GTN36_02115 [Candidatus Aenigmarchaeota archaeon]|nr:hypothetical protein [Candidatus Aenigmarchaeota archaeon]
MRTAIIFIIDLIAAITAFAVFSYIEETLLGFMLAGIMITWPSIFWLISQIFKNRNKTVKESKRIKQDIIDGKELEKGTKKEETSKKDNKEEEFVVPPKKYANMDKLGEDLEKLKKASEMLDEEKKEGILSEEIYNELKNKNKKSIEKLEEAIAKSSGEIREKKVYCPKGKHYIAVSVCFPSKVKGYVICPEHNEEIRSE